MLSLHRCINAEVMNWFQTNKPSWVIFNLHLDASNKYTVKNPYTNESLIVPAEIINTGIDKFNEQL